jgi:hypothetical protein
MKSLILGILLILILGVGGLVYRNAVEHPLQPISCPLDALVCPDGTSVSRTGSSCNFPTCPPPNVTLQDAGISFAIPEGFVSVDAASLARDSTAIASYVSSVATSSSTGIANTAGITIRRYAIEPSATALATIQKTAINNTSGEPASVTSFSSTMLGTHRFTVVSVERFEGTIDTAYYLARGTDVLRFDAIDQGADWTNPNLDVGALPAHEALVNLLTTLQGQ